MKLGRITRDGEEKKRQTGEEVGHCPGLARAVRKQSLLLQLAKVEDGKKSGTSTPAVRSPSGSGKEPLEEGDARKNEPCPGVGK
jgi:hypothetical protein